MEVSTKTLFTYECQLTVRTGGDDRLTTSVSLVKGGVQSGEVLELDSVGDQELGVECSVLEVLHDLLPVPILLAAPKVRRRQKSKISKISRFRLTSVLELVRFR